MYSHTSFPIKILLFAFIMEVSDILPTSIKININFVKSIRMFLITPEEKENCNLRFH